MLDFLPLLFKNLISILPAFLLALLISAILAETLPEHFFENVLGHKNIIFIFLSSLLGALIPLCTCGMIPLASKLQKKGASWLVVVSFLTAGNASSITALFMTIVLGLKITLFRFLFAVIFGIVVSYIFILFFKSETLVSSDGNNGVATYHGKSLPVKILHEYKELLFCFGPWVLAAIVLGVIISLFVSPGNIVKFAGIKNTMSPLILSLSGFPFYFCAGSDIPISKTLLEKGASLGSVLAFMTASPGVNFISLMIYQKWLGLRNAIIYLTVSVLVSGVMGMVVNIFYM